MMVGDIKCCSEKPSEEIVKAHKDYQQVVLDVNRSLKRFPPGIDDDYRIILMGQLTTLIIRVLMKHPELNYYQVLWYLLGFLGTFRIYSLSYYHNFFLYSCETYYYKS